MPSSVGTVQYRAPELILNECKKPMRADIYSAGIILFILKFGHLPYDENAAVQGYDLFDLLFSDPEGFWEAHAKIRGAPLDVDEDFKELFMSMVRLEPEKRASIPQIKKSKWYNKPKYSNKEIRVVMKNIMKPLCQ